MIPANKKPTFMKLFDHYLKWYLIPKTFHAVHVKGQLDQENSHPNLYIINHSSWWDGPILYFLTQRRSQQDHYVMMDEQGLRCYPFFGKLGAFSVNKEKPRDLIETFRYTENLFKKDKSVWLFPQGQVYHQDATPFKFEQGLGRLIQLNKTVNVIPVTFHYYFLEVQKPMVSIVIGKAHTIISANKKRKEWVHYFENVMTEQYHNQKQALIVDLNYHKSDALTPLIKPKKSTSDWLDWLKRR
ncbi:1-acyl-sn-glycerol-3-phosphate acyltransferase [Natronobacillus azotifigens]|uniref:Lysophospholipid acyltransferase family protein n=1 Tax=Natronobacillus azotifigens TaxID=472978 RepID=A0A9J6R8E8_9BACI|nr:lysophospholipid acyltransferase family protein [Natronobacillus azotifigens]MCZ0701920.1 lysophospholipid acyltransferase family protein [Natronobacillus azotifigens]